MGTATSYKKSTQLARWGTVSPKRRSTYKGRSHIHYLIMPCFLFWPGRYSLAWPDPTQIAWVWPRETKRCGSQIIHSYALIFMRALHMKRGEGRSIPQYTNSMFTSLPPPLSAGLLKALRSAKYMPLTISISSYAISTHSQLQRTTHPPAASSTATPELQPKTHLLFWNPSFACPS